MICEKEYLGATLLYATGSSKFGQMLRCIAAWKGFKLNRYGLFCKKTGELVTADEREIFRKCRRAYVEPWDRTDRKQLTKITKEQAA
jgi:DNA polymerase/3'-5' exonuclease PolX